MNICITYNLGELGELHHALTKEMPEFNPDIQETAVRYMTVLLTNWFNTHRDYDKSFGNTLVEDQPIYDEKGYVWFTFVYDDADHDPDWIEYISEFSHELNYQISANKSE